MQGDEQFRISILAKVLDLNIASVIVQHIAAGDALCGNLATGDGDMTDRLFPITDDAKLYLRVLRSFQTVHGLLVGDFLTNKDGVVDLDNLIARQHTGTFRRAIADDVLYTDGVLTDGELDADARERAAQVVVGNLAFAGCDIHGVRVKFTENLGHGLLNEVVHIDGIDVLVVDDMQQVVELIAAGIDDVQPVAREMVGIERTDEDAHNDSHGDPKRCEAV